MIQNDIREGIQHLIELSYDTGYLSAKMEGNPSGITDLDRHAQKELIDTRNRVKIELLGLINDYISVLQANSIPY
jgi:hypothetical protein